LIPPKKPRVTLRIELHTPLNFTAAVCNLAYYYPFTSPTNIAPQFDQSNCAPSAIIRTKSLKSTNRAEKLTYSCAVPLAANPAMSSAALKQFMFPDSAANYETAKKQS